MYCGSRHQPQAPVTSTSRRCWASGRQRANSKNRWEKTNDHHRKRSFFTDYSSGFRGIVRHQPNRLHSRGIGTAGANSRPNSRSTDNLYRQRHSLFRQHRAQCTGGSGIQVGRVRRQHPPGARRRWPHAQHGYGRLGQPWNGSCARAAAGLKRYQAEFDQAKAQYDSAVAALNNAKAFLAESQTAVDDSSLRAPFDGWVIRRTVDIGSLVGPTSPAFTIADTRSVRAVFGVPDNAMGRIKLGQPLAITTDALAGEFSGRVSAISPAADPKSRVYSVEVTIPKPTNRLKSGMIASLALGGEILPTNVLAVPLSAVIRDPQNSQAFAVLVTDGTGDPVIVRSRIVDLGDAYGNMIQVLGGIKAGERVVTAGSTLVKSGEKVRVMQ